MATTILRRTIIRARFLLPAKADGVADVSTCAFHPKKWLNSDELHGVTINPLPPLLSELLESFLGENVLVSESSSSNLAQESGSRSDNNNEETRYLLTYIRTYLSSSQALYDNGAASWKRGKVDWCIKAPAEFDEQLEQARQKLAPDLNKSEFIRALVNIAINATKNDFSSKLPEGYTTEESEAERLTEIDNYLQEVTKRWSTLEPGVKRKHVRYAMKKGFYPQFKQMVFVDICLEQEVVEELRQETEESPTARF